VNVKNGSQREIKREIHYKEERKARSHKKKEKEKRGQE
jgi:hypothetical protein